MVRGGLTVTLFNDIMEVRLGRCHQAADYA